MRYLLLMISLLVLTSTSVTAQKHIKYPRHTDWNTFVINSSLGSYIAFGKTKDGNYSLHLKYVINAPGRPFTTRQGDRFSLSFDDGTYIEIINPQWVSACVGCGAKGLGYSDAWGTYLAFPLSKEEYEMLKTKTLNMFSFQYWTIQEDHRTVNQILKPGVSKRLQKILTL